MRKSFICMVSALAMVSLCVSCSKEEQKGKSGTEYSGSEIHEDHKSTIPSNGFKLMTFNVRYQNSTDDSKGLGWSKRRDGVAEMLKEQKPLVMGVQECLFTQRTDILSNAKYSAIGVGREDGKEKGESMSIFYQTDSISVEKWGTFWLSATPDKVSKGWDGQCIRTCTWALMKHKRLGKEFYYFNTHLDHKGTVARQEGMNLIQAKMHELNPTGLPCVLTADFNCVQSDAIFNNILKEMSNTRMIAPVTDDYATYNAFENPNKGSGSAIDHILINGFGVTEYKTVRGDYAGITFISDHYPVYSILTFK